VNPEPRRAARPAANSKAASASDSPAALDAIPSLGVRAQRKAATRQRLSLSALALFAEHGFDNTSVAEIAAGAQVSERAFFLHFATKADALFDLGSRDYTELENFIRHEPDAPSDYDVLCNATVNFLQSRGDQEFRHRQAALLSQSAASASALRGKQFDENERMGGVAARALAARNGRRRPNLSDQITAVVVIRVLHVSYMEWAEMDPETDFRKVAAARFVAARKSMLG
jgi:AcrR family transcriptional regulator